MSRLDDHGHLKTCTVYLSREGVKRDRGNTGDLIGPGGGKRGKGLVLPTLLKEGMENI